MAATLQERGAQRPLNAEQRRAVAAALCSTGDAIYALNGPPGTGKTVRAELVYQKSSHPLPHHVCQTIGLGGRPPGAHRQCTYRGRIGISKLLAIWESCKRMSVSGDP